jgi:hypothetical protein
MDMFTTGEPAFLLALYMQRSEERRRAADNYRLARAATRGQPRRSHRLWPGRRRSKVACTPAIQG